MVFLKSDNQQDVALLARRKGEIEKKEGALEERKKFLSKEEKRIEKEKQNLGEQKEIWEKKIAGAAG